MEQAQLIPLLRPDAAARVRRDPRGFSSVVDGPAQARSARFDGAYGALYSRVIRDPALRRMAARVLWGRDTPLERLEQVVARVVVRQERQSVLLDVPCGSASLLPLLANSGYRGKVICADLSAEMLSRAASVHQSSADGSGLQPHFLQCDALSLPLLDDSVGCAVSINGLHCMPDHAAFLQELRRVLIPGADAWIVTMLASGEARHRAVVDVARRAGVVPQVPPSSGELREMARDAGFSDVEHLGGTGLAGFRLR